MQVNKITYWTFRTNYDEESYPVVLSSYSFLGDVTELKVINYSFLIKLIIFILYILYEELIEHICLVYQQRFLCRCFVFRFNKIITN